MHTTRLHPYILGAGLLTAAAPCPVAGQPQPLAPYRVEERWRPETPVAARGVVVGLMADPQGTLLNPARLFVDLPAGGPPLLCVTIVSLDGRFEASLEYTPQGATGRLPLVGPTQHLRELRDYTPEQMAVLAHLAERCNRSVTEYVVASWAPYVPDGRVMVMVNAREPTVIRPAPPPSETSPAPSETGMTECPELREPRAVAFNRICRLRLHSGQRVRLLLQRLDGPDDPPPILLWVTVP